MRNLPPMRSEQIVLPVLVLVWLPNAWGGAPSIAVAGAYFPAWLACALAAIFGALLARAGMLASGLAEVLPIQLLVCIAIGLLVAVLVWIAWIGI